VGGALAFDAVRLLAAVLIAFALVASGIAGRRFLLGRGGAAVDCGLRRPAGEGPWRLGVVSYQRDELLWYRVFGVVLRPGEILQRRGLTVVSRRPAAPAEEASLGAIGPALIVVECQLGDGGSVELAMSQPALTGFLAWLEAAPPGFHLDRLA